MEQIEHLPSKNHKEKTPTVVLRISIQPISLPSPVTSAAAPDGGEHMVLPRIVFFLTAVKSHAFLQNVFTGANGDSSSAAELSLPVERSPSEQHKEDPTGSLQRHRLGV